MAAAVAAPYDVPDWVSPDGRFRLARACASTAGNAWICQPRLTDTRDGAVLLDLWGADTWDWDCPDVSAAGAVVTLALRRYGGSTGCTVDVDADARTYALRDAARGGKGLEPVVAALRRGGLAPA